jgi:hypothetical protein
VLQVSLDLALPGGALRATLFLGELALLTEALVVDGEDLSGRFALTSGDGNGNSILNHERRHVLG